ncbi:MAG: 4-(cytidine 5'-diphospho)-2-C-methyl-D-erythritol kinase [Bacteroidetes bacterium]|nr:4-(cytidine 5'-diphospho)-2-C-methyl-D-erythritol kinase [Bacteroidota bacterium]
MVSHCESVFADKVIDTFHSIIKYFSRNGCVELDISYSLRALHLRFNDELCALCVKILTTDLFQSLDFYSAICILSETMIAKAYAKINLGLRILRKRDDGFHDIETVFHRINLFDEIMFENSGSISLECGEPNIPTDDTNLCVRAAKLLKVKYNVAASVHLKLIKNIPGGAGLGGGSSDAACVLLNLSKIWEIDITKEDLFLLASQLGSDVPYFLEKGTAYATGRGEKLEYFELDVPYWIVLVYPNIHISTAWAYGNLKLKSVVDNESLKDILIKHINHPKKLKEKIQNDFEDLVLEKHREIDELKNSLYRYDADFVQMSGSGSSVYAFFNNEQAAIVATASLKENYQTCLTRPGFNPSAIEQ